MTPWARGLLGAIISAASGGILTGLASVGVSPEHFNLQSPALLLKVVLTAVIINALVGGAAYLKQSPLPDK